MGVLGTLIELDKETLINELIYIEVLNKLGINHNIFNYIKNNHNENYTFTESTNIDDSKLINLKELIDYDVENINFSKSNRMKEARNEIYYTSLENIETTFCALYPKYITYNSSRRILNELSKIIAVDYLLGCSNRCMKDIYLDEISKNNYELNSYGVSFNIFEEVAGMTPLIKTLIKYDTIERSLTKALDVPGKNYTTSKFCKYLEEYKEIITNSIFLDILSKVNDENDFELTNSELVTNYLNKYNNQRTLVKRIYSQIIPFIK